MSMMRRRKAAAIRRALRHTAGIYFVLLLVIPACRFDSNRKIAERILDRYRRSAQARPLPASHVIRMRLSPDTGSGGPGVAEIAWEPNRYRERVSSAGVTTERGIQGGKAYYTDEDGVTRVTSEPVLRELLARFYFWRRAWLFRDHGRARLSLGPADTSTVSVRLEPQGANPISLLFSRRDGRLTAVRSPRFDLDFATGRAFREDSGRRPPVRAEIAWIGLPTDRLADAAIGGGCGRFGASSAPVPLERTSAGAVSFLAKANAVALTLALDSAADGPLEVSAVKAKELRLPFTRDVYGRLVAAGATLELGGFSCPGIHVEAVESVPPGCDGIAGGTLFREAVVEVDPKAGYLALHDPARWVSPAGFNRIVIDDDGNRPVARFRRRAENLRLLVGSAAGAADILLAPAAARRLEVAPPGPVNGLRWGLLALPPLSAEIDTGPTSPEWGDDGRLGFALLLRFHSYLDMPHRWIYLRAIESPGPR
jgi:hypothetical protein